MTVAFYLPLFSRHDSHHAASQALFSAHPDWEVNLPEAIMTEVAFLFNGQSGVRAVVQFLHEFTSAMITPILTTPVDYSRAAAIMTTYRMSGLILWIAS